MQQMKSFLLCFIVLIISCRKEENAYVPPCPACTSSIEVNDVAWPSKPAGLIFENTVPFDSSFFVDIYESDPTHDKFSDGLLLSHIPYAVGEYPLVDSIPSSQVTDATLFIYEGGYDFVSDYYNPIFNKSSVIRVDSLDKSTGAVSVSFDLTLYTPLDLNGQVRNTTFPGMVRVKGVAKGVVMGH